MPVTSVAARANSLLLPVASAVVACRPYKRASLQKSGAGASTGHGATPSLPLFGRNQQAPDNRQVHIGVLMMILRRQGLAFVGRYFIATIDTPVDTGMRRKLTRIPTCVECRMRTYTELLTVFIKGH